MRILITGGTGTLGHALAYELRNNDITIFSRSEVKQVEMKEQFPDFNYVIGDVRDYRALKAMRKFDMIYHLAALKHVPICQAQPVEAFKTNVEGTLNVLKLAKKVNCPVFFMSTDKAENPESVYGCTKRIAEICVLNAGGGVIRTGNIFGSSGSVIPLFVKSVRENNEIKLTDGNMTRFFISASELAMYLVYFPLLCKIVAPPMKAYRMGDIAEMVRAIYGDSETKITETGIRPGEKMHEVLLGRKSEESLGTLDELEKLFNSWSQSF